MQNARTLSFNGSKQNLSSSTFSQKKEIQHTDALLQSVWQNMRGVNNGKLLGKITACAQQGNLYSLKHININKF